MREMAQNNYAQSLPGVGGATRLTLGALIGLWMARRAERQQLAALDQALLDDIGITHAEARHEAAKPFWQA